MRARWLVAMVAMLGVPLLPAGAQLAELVPGTRVRVRAPTVVAGRLTGAVIARTADSVTITRPDAAPVAIPVRALTSLEISRGKSRARGAGKGALWGGGTMLVLGAIPFSDRPCKDEQDEPDCERIGAVENALLSGIGGAIIGALIGTAVGAERWVRAAVPVTVSAAPLFDGRGAPSGWHLGARLTLSR